MTKTFLLTIPLALTASAMIAAPASAAAPHKGSKISHELRQLDRKINVLPGLSYSEEARLERRVSKVRALNRRYIRNGYSRAELRTLNRRIASIESSIRYQARDSDRRSVKRKTRLR